MVDDVPIAGDNAKSELRALAENIQNSLKKSTVEKIKLGSGLFKPANFSRLTMRLVTGARTAFRD